MGTIEQYSAVRNNAKSAISSISELRGELSSLKETFEDGIVINGKAFDDGVITECLAQLQNISDNYSTISNYCAKKIQELKEQQIALNRRRQELLDSAAGGPKIFDDRKTNLM